MTDQFAHDDAAYLLGALPADERAAFEQHLTRCPECRARVREVEDLPALLRDVAAADFADEEPPDTLLPGLLRRAGAERRRHRWLVSGLSAVAAACLVALTVVVWPSGSSSPARPAARALAAVVASPVQADAVLVTRAWGTEIDLHCRYADYVGPGRPYLLVVRDRHGRSERLGTWTLPPGKQINFTAGTSLPPSQIGQVEVALTDGTPILRLSN